MAADTSVVIASVAVAAGLATVVTELDVLVAALEVEVGAVLEAGAVAVSGAEKLPAAGPELVVIEVRKNIAATVVVFDFRRCRSVFAAHIADFVEPDCCCNRLVAELALAHIAEPQPTACTKAWPAEPEVALQRQGIEPALNIAEPLLESVVDSFELVPETVQEPSWVVPVFVAAGQDY